LPSDIDKLNNVEPTFTRFIFRDKLLSFTKVESHHFLAKSKSYSSILQLPDERPITLVVNTACHSPAACPLSIDATKQIAVTPKSGKGSGWRISWAKRTAGFWSA